MQSFPFGESVNFVVLLLGHEHVSTVPVAAPLLQVYSQSPLFTEQSTTTASKRDRNTLGIKQKGRRNLVDFKISRQSCSHILTQSNSQ